MTKLNVFLSALLAVALVAGPALAAQTATDPTVSGPEVSATYTEKQLVGLDVVGKRGDLIGKIKDVNVDPASGKINFVIVGKAGVAGDEHAVPLAALTIRSDQGKATLLVPEDKLATAPVQASGVSDNEFRGHIEEYYGVAPIWNAPMGETKPMTPEKMEEDYPAGSNY